MQYDPRSSTSGTHPTPRKEKGGRSLFVRFWGTRGSIAVPGEQTTKFGGNTACVEVRTDDGTIIVLDCGTGVRELGHHLLQAASQPLRLHLFIGHTHWDHIQGFPFFGPAFLPHTELNIYAPVGFHRRLEDAIAGQMQYSYFPVKLHDLRSRIHFTELDEGFFRIGEVLVQTQHLNHTAPTLAYRISSHETTLAYVTDHEPYWRTTGREFQHPGDQRHVAFLEGRTSSSMTPNTATRSTPVRSVGGTARWRTRPMWRWPREATDWRCSITTPRITTRPWLGWKA